LFWSSDETWTVIEPHLPKNQPGARRADGRRVIARVLSEADDHRDVESLHERASAIDPRISIATVYRTVRLFDYRKDHRPWPWRSPMFSVWPRDSHSLHANGIPVPESIGVIR
jgi:transposase